MALAHRFPACRKPLQLAAAVFLAALLLPAAASAAQARKVILDIDPGTDDAMAVLLALNSPELEVLALTVVPGNVTLELGVQNARKLASLTDRCDIPVAAGAPRPLAQPVTTAEFWHGRNGLANVELPAPRCPLDPRFAPDLIIELVHAHPGQITLLPVGPLTNIALAVLKDPSIVPEVKEVILMGGSITGGNVTAAAEANIHNDPEAAQIVFTAGWPLTMVGLGVGNASLFGPAHLAQLTRTRGPQTDFAAAIMKHLIDLSAQFDSPGTPLYDALAAAAAAIDPTVVTTEAMHVEVETRGEMTRGETVANRYNFTEHRVWQDGRWVIDAITPVEPNAQVCVGVDAERFLQLLITRIRGH